MIRFEEILDEVERYKPDFDEELLRRAYIFSAREHKNQVRSSGEPYLIHPLNVAWILAELRLDEKAIAVGLLHDVLEDTLTTRESLEELFGEEIAAIVDGVTKISRYSYVSREEQQAETFRKMILAMASDLRVVLVKLADRLHNMRTLDYLPPERQALIAKETLEIYAPIANRLGMGKIKHELEELAFRYLLPDEERELRLAVERQVSFSEQVVADLAGAIASRMTESGIEAEVTGRVKSLYSIHKKLQRHAAGVHQIYDYLAFRLITPGVKDCYGALGMIHQTWRPVPGRFKDYIAMSKPNLYQSLHTTLLTEGGQPFEVQIRTREMDLVAERGIAAHWKYKEGRITAPDDANFVWLRQLVDLQQDVKDPRVFLTSLKIDLYADEVYTFTPRGEVFGFPKGATPLDFAYRIHTDVGHRCTGARVNGKLVQLGTQLTNGDIVEIVTAATQSPNQEWLNLVVTPRARHKIRQWLNSEQKRRSIEVGKKLLEKEARRLKVPLKKVAGEAAMADLLREHGLARLDDLYAELGFGKLSARTVLERYFPQDSGERAPETEGTFRAAVRKLFPFGSSSAIRVLGQKDLMSYLARCCNALPGEPIVGYVTRGKGVVIHTVNCPNVGNLMFNTDREIAVEWSDEESARFETSIEISVEDRPGILANVIAAVAELKTNIKQIEAKSAGGRGLISVSVEVSSARHLHKVIRSISRIKGVDRVERAYRTAAGGVRSRLP